MKFLIFADPLSGLKADFDSGLAMLREGLKRGHEMHWCVSDDFYLRGDELYVFSTRVMKCEEDKLPRLECASLSLGHPQFNFENIVAELLMLRTGGEVGRSGHLGGRY